MSLREEGREGWREGGEGGEGAMMLGRERVSVDEWRVDEGNERGRDGARERGRDEASGGGIGRGRKGVSKGASEGGKHQGMHHEEGTIQYTVYSQTIPQRGLYP